MYLLDTNVVSALRRPDRSPVVVRWLENQRSTDLYLSVITVGEIERGFAQQRRLDPIFARELASWLDEIIGWYDDRILGIDVATARRWGQLSATIGHSSVDLLIAATALENGLAVVTRNVSHFESTGVRVVNPFI